MRDVRNHHGFNPEAPSGVPAVLRSRRPVLVPQATETDVENASRNAEQLAMFRTLDLRSWMIVPLIARDHILGAMTFVVTESDRRYGPDDLALAEAVAQRAAIAIDNARLYQDALGARADAEAANRLKDEFLAMLGHELRNPLGAISNAVHILDRVEDARGQSATQAREIIARQVGHLSGLVDDLLDVGRVMTGKIKLDRSPLDLHEAAGRALRTLRAAGKAGGHTVTLHGEPVWIDGDVERDRADRAQSRRERASVYARRRGHPARGASPGYAGGSARGGHGHGHRPGPAPAHLRSLRPGRPRA